MEYHKAQTLQRSVAVLTFFLLRESLKGLFIGAVVGVLGFSQSPAPATSIKKGSQATSATPEAEARALAKRLWESRYTRCGESYYSLWYGRYLDPSGHRANEWTGTSSTGPSQILEMTWGLVSAEGHWLAEVPLRPRNCQLLIA